MEHILLVDDDANHRMSLRDLLDREGFVCVEVEDGEAALEKLSQTSFDLVITDLYMPVTNGFDLLVAMAKDHNLTTTPVIVTTKSADENLRRYVLGLGAATILVTPYPPRDLVSLVARTIHAATVNQ